jgi:hypothetical protein
MPNPFGKSRPTENPYAIYAGPAGFEWRVLKTYKLAKNEDSYSRWFVAAKSEATYGSFEMGDTYKGDVTSFGRLVAADPSWLEAYRSGGGYAGLPTVSEYLEQVS